MHWGYGIFGCSPCFTHFCLFAHVFYPFPPHLLFFSVDCYGDTLSGCLLRDIILPSSFLRPTSSIDLSTGDRVFYTRSNGLRPPATVVGTAEDGLLHLEYYQDGLRVVNRQCKMGSISFAIPSSDSPPHCPPSPPPNTQSSSPPKALGPSPLLQEPGRSPSRSPPVQFGLPNSKVVSKGRA